MHQRKKFCDGYSQTDLSDTIVDEIDGSTSMLEKTPSMAILEVKTESTIPRKIFLTPKSVFNLEFLTRNPVANSTFRSPTNIPTSLMPEQFFVINSSSSRSIDSVVSTKIETTTTQTDVKVGYENSTVGSIIYLV